MTPQYNAFEPFKYKNIDKLEAKLKELNLSIPISTNFDILKGSIKIKNQIIPNRLAIQPMEGFDAELNGSPSELTKRRYERFASGGAGIIWFEATAVTIEGRTNTHQLMLSDQNLKKFIELVSMTRNFSKESLKELGMNHPALLILQLNHSGRYSKKDDISFPIRTFTQENQTEEGIIISDIQLEKLEDIWVNKSLLAREAGFDGVDIKACHGYLINDLLKARLRENSDYGGYSFENRTRFYLNIIKKLVQEIGKDDKFLITSRLGVYDGFPYPNGFGVKEIEGESYPASINLIEPIKLAKILYDRGIRLLNITAGNPYYQPHVTRPYDTPLKGAHLPNEHPLYSAWRILDLAAQMKKQLPSDMIIMGSGYSYFRQHGGEIAAGVVEQGMADVCGFGRMAFANPNFPKQVFQSGCIDKGLTCITCSKCTQRMRDGLNTGCLIRDEKYKKN